MKFYLGAHHPHWLERAPFPLFVSHRRLAGRRWLPRATTGWALDSGGFTELRLHVRWSTSMWLPSDGTTMRSDSWSGRRRRTSVAS